jgi:hypothetical protein
MLANRHVVADLNEVVDFRAALNPCATETGPVHGGVGSDFDIVVDLHGAGLWDFLLLAIAEQRTVPAVARATAIAASTAL